MLSLRTPSVRDYFPYEPTDDQALLFTQLDAFLKDQLPGRKILCSAATPAPAKPP